MMRTSAINPSLAFTLSASALYVEPVKPFVISRRKGLQNAWIFSSAFPQMRQILGDCLKSFINSSMRMRA